MYSGSKEYVLFCKFKLYFCCFIWIASEINLLLSTFFSFNIITFSQSKSCWWIILCFVITECYVVSQFMWFICSFMRIFKHLLVWPIYNASQSRQSILYTTSVWDNLEQTSLWFLMNSLTLLIPLYAICVCVCMC